MSDQICNSWKMNMLVNPETKRKIKVDGPVYKKLKKLCTSSQQVTPKRKVPNFTSLLKQKQVKPPSPKQVKPPSPKQVKKIPNFAPLKKPTKVKSKSPAKVKSKSPAKVKSKSPTKVKSKSPTKVKSKSPTKVKSKSKSPTKVKSKSPTSSIKMHLQVQSLAPVKLALKDKVTQVLQLVNAKQLKLNPCTILDDKKTVKRIQNILITHTTASPTENIRVNLELLDGTPLTIFLKIWPNLNEIRGKMYDHVAVEFEKDMYKYITEKILNKGQSPNFIPFLAHGKCPFQTRAYDITKDFDFFIPKVDLHDPNLRLNVLMTGSSPNITELEGFQLSDPHERASILFQVTHAIYCLQRHGITHCDLHFKNILLEVLDSPIILQYNTNALSVTFETRYIVKIFDFDNSYSRQSLVNKAFQDPIKRSNYSYPMRENFIDMDFYQIICQFLGNPNFKSLVENLLPPAAPQNMKNIMNHGNGRKFSIQISKQSGDEILKEKLIFPDDKNVFDIPTSTLKQLLSPAEYTKLSSYEDFPIIKSLLFSLKPVAKGYTLSPMSGWYCRMVHFLKDDILFPLADFFTKPALFQKLTAGLKLSPKAPEGIFVL
jgi:hypothetical protein